MKTQSSSYEMIIADLTHQLYRARLISRGWKALAKRERATIEAIINLPGDGNWDTDEERRRVISHERKIINQIRQKVIKLLHDDS